MPDATTSAQKFDVSRRRRSFLAGGVGIATLPFDRQRQRRDTGMWVPAGARLAKRRVRIDEVEKDERLDQLADIRCAGHANERPVCLAAGSIGHTSADTNDGGGRWLNDASHGTLCRQLGVWPLRRLKRFGRS